VPALPARCRERSSTRRRPSLQLEALPELTIDLTGLLDGLSAGTVTPSGRLAVGLEIPAPPV